jgi:hypothetical protein
LAEVGVCLKLSLRTNQKFEPIIITCIRIYYLVNSWYTMRKQVTLHELVRNIINDMEPFFHKHIWQN